MGSELVELRTILKPLRSFGTEVTKMDDELVEVLTEDGSEPALCIYKAGSLNRIVLWGEWYRNITDQLE